MRKQVPRQVKLLYEITGNIDEVIEAATKLKNARDSLKSSFDGTIECSVGHYGTSVGFYVILVEKQEGKLEAALNNYLSDVGILPSFVAHESDFDCCNRVLAEYGKVLRWRFAGSALGKYVADSPKR